MRSWLSRNVGRLVLLLLALLLFGWVLSGDDNGGEVDTPERSTTVKVGLTGSHAESVERVLQLQGQAEPEQVVRVRAKTGGEVAEAPVEEGAVVEADAAEPRAGTNRRGPGAKDEPPRRRKFPYRKVSELEADIHACEAAIESLHQQLADELGSVREIVSRLLKGFASQGLVSLGREQVAVVDREGLQKLATV